MRLEEAGQNSVRYFTDWALPQLDMLLPETFEPIEVWTTLDVGMQRAATASIKANTPDGAQGALVSMDRDGAVLALVGGTDYVQTNYNRATDALRQPGSRGNCSSISPRSKRATRPTTAWSTRR